MLWSTFSAKKAACEETSATSREGNDSVTVIREVIPADGGMVIVIEIRAGDDSVEASVSLGVFCEDCEMMLVLPSCWPQEYLSVFVRRETRIIILFKNGSTICLQPKNWFYAVFDACFFGLEVRRYIAMFGYSYRRVS